MHPVLQQDERTGILVNGLPDADKPNSYEFDADPEHDAEKKNWKCSGSVGNAIYVT